MICVNCIQCPHCNGTLYAAYYATSACGEKFITRCQACWGKGVVCGGECLASDVAESTDNEENV